jgi:hypothetical protein
VWTQYTPHLFTEFDFSFGTFFAIPFKPVPAYFSVSLSHTLY